MFHLDGLNSQTTDPRAAGLTEEFADKLDRTGHSYSASALRVGLVEFDKGNIDMESLVSNLNAAHTQDHQHGQPTEGDPAFYGAAGAAWTGGQAPKDLAEVIGEALRAVIGDDVDGISVVEADDPFLSADELMVLQTVLIFISGAYATKEHPVIAQLGEGMMHNASNTLRQLFKDMGADSPMNAVIDIIRPLEQKLDRVRRDMLAEKTSGMFVAPF